MSTITIYYYYSALKLILILPSHGGYKAESILVAVTCWDGLSARKWSANPSTNRAWRVTSLIAQQRYSYAKLALINVLQQGCLFYSTNTRWISQMWLGLGWLGSAMAFSIIRFTVKYVMSNMHPCAGHSPIIICVPSHTAHWFSDSTISQVSVATQLWCGGIWKITLSLNSCCMCQRKKNWKSVNIWQRHGLQHAATVFD